MNPFIKDRTVWVDGVEMRVVRQLANQDVQLEKTTSGELVSHEIQELLQKYANGQLLTAPMSDHQPMASAKNKQVTPGMERMSEAACFETKRRVEYVTHLERIGAFEKSRKDLKTAVGDFARERGDGCSPHVSTIYRWRATYQKAQRDVRALFSKLFKQGGKGASRLEPEVEAIICDKIDTIFLVQKKSSAEEVWNGVRLHIERSNKERVESEQLPIPGLRTIQRRLQSLCAYDVSVARYGEKEADRRFANQAGSRPVSRILEMVEIDHSPVDLMVVDEHGTTIGRPTITVVLDRFSRCVLGFHLSLAGHGTPAVFSALRHALMPKSYLKERYADLQLEWDCYGWFELLVMDNGLEFHSEAVVEALLYLGIATEYAKSRTPNDKPHVERFLKTFNYSFIHRLKGTTLAKIHQRIGFKAEEQACITMEELDRIIHVWICQVYHVRPHAGLNGRSPLSVWKESAAAFPPQLKANKEDLDIEFSQTTSSALQHYGIDLNTFVYVSPRLLTLRRMLPVGARVDVKWPSHDVGHIYVWDSINEEHFRVDNKTPGYAGLTVEQAKTAKKAQAAAEPDSQLAIATAQGVIRDRVNTLMKDKALKSRKKGARLANQTSEVHRHGSSRQTVMAEEFTPAFPVESRHDRQAMVELPEIEESWMEVAE